MLTDERKYNHHRANEKVYFENDLNITWPP